MTSARGRTGDGAKSTGQPRRGEPSAKRAKVDEADEEEDPLVRRKEELVGRKGGEVREDARAERVAKKELVTSGADFEAKNEKLLGRLLPGFGRRSSTSTCTRATCSPSR